MDEISKSYKIKKVSISDKTYYKVKKIQYHVDMHFESVLKCNIMLLRKSVVIVSLPSMICFRYVNIALRLLIVLSFCACLHICICVTVHICAYFPDIVTVSVVDEVADDLRLFLSNSLESISGQLHEHFQKLFS